MLKPGPVSLTLSAACWSRCRTLSYLFSTMSACVLPCLLPWWPWWWWRTKSLNYKPAPIKLFIRLAIVMVSLCSNRTLTKTSCRLCLAFYVGLRVLSSGPPACTVSALTHGLSSPVHSDRSFRTTKCIPICMLCLLFKNLAQTKNEFWLLKLIASVSTSQKSFNQILLVYLQNVSSILAHWKHKKIKIA
jgi:hypothetical protein